MSDLEKSILKWRQQMLAAGIKTPVPLGELEIHLREEIERQIRSGLNEQKAFEISAQTIGQPKTLNSEFNKVEHHKMKRLILMIIGWLAAGATLLYAAMYFDFNWSFLIFRPKCDLETAATVLIILAAETGIWFLAKASRERANRVVALLVCVLLAGFGIFDFFPAEQRTAHATFVSGSDLGRIFVDMLNSEPPTPLWFRGSLTLLLCLPGAFWIWWERRRVVQDRSSITL